MTTTSSGTQSAINKKIWFGLWVSQIGLVTCGYQGDFRVKGRILAIEATLHIA